MASIFGLKIGLSREGLIFCDSRLRSIIHENVPFLGQFWSQRLGMGSVVTGEGQVGYFWQRANYIWHLTKYWKTTGGFL